MRRASAVKASLKRARLSPRETKRTLCVKFTVADAKPSDLHMSVEKLLDEVCVGVKGQSNLEIARTPRKAFRCRVWR